MRLIARLARIKISSERFDARVSQVVFFVGALLFFCGTTWALTTLNLSEGQLLIGLLASIACMLLMILIGLVLPISALSAPINQPCDQQ